MQLLLHVMEYICACQDCFDLTAHIPNHMHIALVRVNMCCMFEQAAAAPLRMSVRDVRAYYCVVMFVVCETKKMCINTIAL